MQGLSTETILFLVAILGFILTLLTFAANRRKDTAASSERDAKTRAEVFDLRRDLDRALLRIADLEANARKNEIDMVELKNDVKHILVALEKIEKKLDKEGC